MSHQVFVPVTDDIIYNHPEQIEGPLIPYFAGMECQNWLAIEINPDESDEANLANRKPELRGATQAHNSSSTSRRPELRLAYSA